MGARPVPDLLLQESSIRFMLWDGRNVFIAESKRTKANKNMHRPYHFSNN